MPSPEALERLADGLLEQGPLPRELYGDGQAAQNSWQAEPHAGRVGWLSQRHIPVGAAKARAVARQEYVMDQVFVVGSRHPGLGSDEKTGTKRSGMEGVELGRWHDHPLVTTEVQQDDHGWNGPPGNTARWTCVCLAR